MEIDALEQLPDEILDELISADIDGELDAAVQDLEITVSVSEIRDWFTTSSRASSRYAALRSAAFLFGQPLGRDLDQVSKRRMVKITLGHTQALPSGRTQRLSLLVAASAACITLVVGIAVSLARDTDTDTEATKLTTTSSLGAAITQQPEVGIDSTIDSVTDLGNVADVKQLRTKLNALLTSNGSASTTTTPSNSGGVQRETTAEALQESAGAHCTASLPGAAAANGLTILATAKLGAQRVAIVTATDTQGRALRWAYRTSDCSILFVDRASGADL